MSLQSKLRDEGDSEGAMTTENRKTSMTKTILRCGHVLTGDEGENYLCILHPSRIIAETDHTDEMRLATWPSVARKTPELTCVSVQHAMPALTPAGKLAIACDGRESQNSRV